MLFITRTPLRIANEHERLRRCCALVTGHWISLSQQYNVIVVVIFCSVVFVTVHR